MKNNTPKTGLRKVLYLSVMSATLMNFATEGFAHKMMSSKEMTKVFQAEKSVATIEQAMQEALLSNPEILFQKSEREASRHRVTQSVGNYFPSIDLRAGAGREYVKQSFRDANEGLGGTRLSSEVRAEATSNRYDPSAKVTQLLFDGLETRNDIKKAKHEFVQSTKNVEEAQTLAAFDVYDRYISVRRFERLYRLALDNVRVHQSILSRIGKLVEGGKATSGDQQSVRSRLFDAKAAVSDIEGDLQNAYANFKEVVGAEAKNLKIPTLHETKVPYDVQAAVAIAREHNKSVVVAKATEAVARAEYDKTIAPFMPALNLELEARRQFNVGGKSGHETTGIAQVVGTFNVLNGGKDVGRRKEFRARLTSAKFRTQQEIRRAEKEARVSYAELMSARSQSHALNKAVASKQSVRGIYMKQFDAGTRSFIDILDASHEYFLAKGSLITADAIGDLAAARLLASMGQLVENFKSLNIKPDLDEGVIEAFAKEDSVHVAKAPKRGTTVMHASATKKNNKAGKNVYAAASVPSKGFTSPTKMKRGYVPSVPNPKTGSYEVTPAENGVITTVSKEMDRKDQAFQKTIADKKVS